MLGVKVAVGILGRAHVRVPAEKVKTLIENTAELDTTYLGSRTSSLGVEDFHNFSPPHGEVRLASVLA